MLLAALALAPRASADVAISQTDSPDPVMRGENVQMTVTVTNTGAAAEDVGIETLIFKQGQGIRAGNPYVSQTPTQGSCSQYTFPSERGDFYGIECDFGSVAPGASARVDASIQVNESMTHTVYLKDPLSGVSEEDTSVVYPPELSGSKKIKLRGVPEDCETGDFTIRARVKATDVRRLIGKLRGPYEEGWSGHAGGGRRELARSNRLAFEIPAERMRDGFYELQFVARRKGAPQLKREVKFQLC